MARQERYTHLEHYRKKSNAKWICLAHHLDDLQEDILMRLMRGSGWPALGGMQAMDAKRRILRPLLLQEKQELYALLKCCELGYAQDESNYDTSYLRNRVRHNILPLIHAENPSFKQKTLELWKFAVYDNEHWQNTVLELFTKHEVTIQNNSITLSAAMLKSVNKATRLRLYMQAINLLNQAQARANTLLELDNAWEEGRGNTTFQLANGLEAKLKKGSILFSY